MRISALLGALARGPSQRIAVGEMVDALRERGFGLVTLLLALPNAIPGPAVPGLSAVTGVPLALLAMQMAWGRPEPVLPAWLRRRSIARSGFARTVGRLRPVLERLEVVIRPRYPRLTGPRAERLLGAWIAFAALVMCNPLPFGNLPMGWGLATLALGLLERDGLAVLLGLGVTGLGVAWNFVLIWAGAGIVDWLWQQLGA